MIELRKESNNEGFMGLASLYSRQDSKCFNLRQGEGCLSPFVLLNELESGLKSHSLINNEDVKAR